MNKKGFTLVETLIAAAFTVILMMVVVGFYSTIKGGYSSSLAGRSLQEGANLIVAKIIEGSTEATGIFRLSESGIYCIGSGANCSGPVTTAEVHFVSSDLKERWYKLGSPTTLVYHHPTAAAPAGADEMIYTAPAGSVITLMFWYPDPLNPTPAVGVSVTLTQTVSGKTYTGSATTTIYMRNHS